MFFSIVNCLPPSPSGAILRYKDILAMPSEAEISQIAAEQSTVQPDAACTIQFTSGTTGNPKAALLSHMSVVNNGIHISNRTEMPLREHRICVQVPLFHVYGVVIAIMAAMAHGTTLVLPAAGYNVEAALKAIATERFVIKKNK